MLDVRCKYLQLIVILLPICQLGVHPLFTVQSPAPVIVAAVKLLSGAGPAPGPLHWSHWPLVPTLGQRRQYLERASAECLCILFIRNIPCRNKPNDKCLLCVS